MARGEIKRFFFKQGNSFLYKTAHVGGGRSVGIMMKSGLQDQVDDDKLSPSLLNQEKKKLYAK